MKSENANNIKLLYKLINENSNENNYQDETFDTDPSDEENDNVMSGLRVGQSFQM